MTNVASKTERLLDALMDGDRLTNKQIQSRFGFTNPGSVSKAIYRLRTEGFPIWLNRRVDSKGRVKHKYTLGTASRRIIAAGCLALSSMGESPLEG